MRLRIWPKNKIVRVLITIALAVLIFPLGYSRLTSGRRAIRTRQVPPAPSNQLAAAWSNQLRIASFNIAHGRGLAESNLGGGPVDERLNRLDAISELLRNVDADIVVLNEVDFDSQWSYSVNQAEYLAKKAGYSQWVEQRNMDFRLAFWNWSFGNAILSRFPIKSAELVPLPGHSILETIVLGKKQAVVCEVELPSGPIRVIGAHLSQRSEAVRVASTQIVIDRASQSLVPTVLAGDLNSSPPGFNASSRDASGRNAIDLLDRSEQFHRWSNITPHAPEHGTFHARSPSVVIDWIFIPKLWQFEDFRVDQQVLSDHRLTHAKVLIP